MYIPDGSNCRCGRLILSSGMATVWLYCNIETKDSFVRAMQIAANPAYAAYGQPTALISGRQRIREIVSANYIRRKTISST